MARTCAVVVAHPDDESLFFGGVIARRRDVDWHVVCVTDGGGGGDPADRSRELRDACARLGVDRVDELGFPDRGRRPLAIDDLVPRLTSTITAPVVLTHGIHDVHPHHHQVLLACCLAFGSERVSMYEPRAPLDDRALREKRALLAAAYPTQFHAEELLRRYPWWLEGVARPQFAVLDSLPLDADLLPTTVRNAALSAELVTHPLRMLARADPGLLAARLPVDPGLIQVSRVSLGDVARRLVHEAAEAVMAAGKPHHMAWYSGLASILDHANRAGRLVVFEQACGTADSAWIRGAAGWHQVLRHRRETLGADGLGTIARAARDAGCTALWMAPDEPRVASLEALDPSLLTLAKPVEVGEPLGAFLWDGPR